MCSDVQDGKERLVEHKVAMRIGDMKNGIAVDTWEQQHKSRLDREEASVLEQEPR